MITEKKGDRVYMKSGLIDEDKFAVHGFTTRMGGVSRGKVSGLNLGFRCGDDAESVRKNYLIVAEDLGLPYASIVASRQTHSTNIRVVTEEDKGKGVSRESDIFETDGLITNRRNIPLVIFYADCVPLLMTDSVSGAVAAIHSGWRGTADKIAEKAVAAMRAAFGTKPENLKAAIGPSIGPCCFECGEEVAALFPGEVVTRLENGKFKADLWKANTVMLENCGVRHENIDVFQQCTMCRSDIYYSYRSHGAATGRMGAFIMIK